MSWIQKLYDTYERCAGSEPPGSELLMPICHTMQQAQIEVVLDGLGGFKRASVIDKTQSNTMIPCTESSGGRAGKKPVNHPLCDKLQYVAGDFVSYGGEVTSGFAKDATQPHRDFLASLRGWAHSAWRHPKLDAILTYVERGRIINDLVSSGVLPDGGSCKLLKVWDGDKNSAPEIFKVIQNTQEPADAFVRWKVEDEAGNPVSGTWQDTALIEAWIDFYRHSNGERGICMVSGDEAVLAIQHPAKLRHGGDKAKLISANDDTGYTFRGRFTDSAQAASVGFEVTQKAHNALRWLIARQAYRKGDQAVVSWAVSGKPLPDPLSSSLALFGVESTNLAPVVTGSNASQAFARRLKSAIAGYGSKLEATDDVVVMGLDSATPGRMAITYYRELKGSEFLYRIVIWHSKCAWAQNFGKEKKFIGAPSPADIAEGAYGTRVDDKLRKATVERLLPCIVDGLPVPFDLVKSTTQRASNRLGLDHWDWERCLGIACALFKGYHTERNYQMALEQDRTSRDYLYGRLLAIAENIEGRALFVAGERRETTAARLMQRFADRPFSTWKTIELALSPYKTRLRTQRAGFLHGMEALLDEVMALFIAADFSKDCQLSGEFLLGYHCQRQALKPNELPDNAPDNQASNNNGEN